MRRFGLPRGRRKHDRSELEAALNRADAVLTEDPARAERLAAEVARDSRTSGEIEIHVEALTIRAAALRERERHVDALGAAEQAVALSPQNGSAWNQVAAAAYRVADFDRSLTAYERVVKLVPDDADAWHSLGRAAVWTGDRARSAGAFGIAAHLDPENFVIPIRVATVEFISMAMEVWRTIPDSFKSRMVNTMVAVEELPDTEDVAGGLDPDILGFYEGSTVLDDGDWFERILLFQRNHEAVCATLGELREEVRRTILHEAGHHFGMEDGELPY